MDKFLLDLMDKAMMNLANITKNEYLKYLEYEMKKEGDTYDINAFISFVLNTHIKSMLLLLKRHYKYLIKTFGEKDESAIKLDLFMKNLIKFIASDENLIFIGKRENI